MFNTMTPHYPDLLGYVTGGQRVNINVVQTALAVRPRVLRAGKPFEIILLVQNVTDSNVDVMAVLHLPQRFVTKKAKIVVGLSAAEVGYIVLPASALPDTPPGDSYKLGVEVHAKPLAQPNRVREAGGEPLDVSHVPGEILAKLDELQKLSFSTSKRLGRPVLEAPLPLMSGNLGQITDFTPGWVSLWTMGDVTDERALIARYAEDIRFKILLQLKREHTVRPLAEETQARFTAAGYPLHPLETLMIAKVMALILEYAVPRNAAHDPFAAGGYNLLSVLAEPAKAMQQSLPYWFRGMLRSVARDERTITHAVAAVTKLLYEDLLRDALMHGFKRVEALVGEDLGTEMEMQAHADRLIGRLHAKSGLDFTYVYMPLVISGILINDQILEAEENFIETLRAMWLALDDRRDEVNEDNAPIMSLAETAIERALHTYGFRRSST